MVAEETPVKIHYSIVIVMTFEIGVNHCASGDLVIVEIRVLGSTEIFVAVMSAEEMQERGNHLQVHKPVWPPSFVEESTHVVILVIRDLLLDLILNSLNFIWVFVHVLWVKVPELLKLVITVLIDVDGVLPLFDGHDISAIFDA